MIGLATEAALPVALALEMIHCFTLIHDDLPCMDNDDFRRGLPSNHKKFGEAIALLAGDSLMPLATEVFLESFTHVPPPCFARGLARFTWAIGPRGVAGGQAAESLLGASSTLRDLYHMHELKTGALFTAALLIPKDLAGIEDSSPKGQAIAGFARELGIAFQVMDDLEDAPSDPGAPHAPTSVLHYQSAESSASEAHLRLSAACSGLSREFGGSAAAELVLVAGEVLRRLTS